MKLKIVKNKTSSSIRFSNLVEDEDGNYLAAFQYSSDANRFIEEYEKNNSPKKGKTVSKREFVVSMAVDGRVDITVDAEDADEAFAEAEDAFMDIDLGKIEVVDARPVNAYDVESETLTDY